MSGPMMRPDAEQLLRLLETQLTTAPMTLNTFQGGYEVAFGSPRPCGAWAPTLHKALALALAAAKPVEADL